MAPPARPSAQTNFVLSAMADAEKGNAERWEKVFRTLDSLAGQMKEMDTTQKQLMG
jgi:hypothetical protein